MKNTIRKFVELNTILIAFFAFGCAVEVAPEDSEESIEKVTSELWLYGEFYDGPGYKTFTQCPIGGLNIHCCPYGSVMKGIHVDHNVLKCVWVWPGMKNDRSLDYYTQREGMHACPYGKVMVGVHVNRNTFICQSPDAGILDEYTDKYGSDGYMHVCANQGYAMTGLHVGKNRLLCGF